MGLLYGCTVCAACCAVGSDPDAFARFAARKAACVKPWQLNRHAASKCHCAAMEAHLQKDGTLAVGAPAAEEFVAAWRALGGRGRSSEAKARSRRKLNTVGWCLWQAQRDGERCFLASAETVSIQMDERKGWARLTYAACKGTKVTSGVFAQF